MLKIGQIALLIYGLLLGVGGVMGYVKGKSQISLITGIGSGILALVGYWFSLTQPTVGFSLGIGLGVVLTIVFLIRFQKTGKVMPAGLMCGLSIVAAAISGLALLRPGN